MFLKMRKRLGAKLNATRRLLLKWNKTKSFIRLEKNMLEAINSVFMDEVLDNSLTNQTTSFTTHSNQFQETRTDQSKKFYNAVSMELFNNEIVDKFGLNYLYNPVAFLTKRKFKYDALDKTELDYLHTSINHYKSQELLLHSLLNNFYSNLALQNGLGNKNTSIDQNCSIRDERQVGKLNHVIRKVILNLLENPIHTPKPTINEKLSHNNELLISIVKRHKKFENIKNILYRLVKSDTGLSHSISFSRLLEQLQINIKNVSNKDDVMKKNSTSKLYNHLANINTKYIKTYKFHNKIKTIGEVPISKHTYCTKINQDDLNERKNILEVNQKAFEKLENEISDITVLSAMKESMEEDENTTDNEN